MSSIDFVKKSEKIIVLGGCLIDRINTSNIEELFGLYYEYPGNRIIQNNTHIKRVFCHSKLVSLSLENAKYEPKKGESRKRITYEEIHPQKNINKFLVDPDDGSVCGIILNEFDAIIQSYQDNVKLKINICKVSVKEDDSIGYSRYGEMQSTIYAPTISILNCFNLVDIKNISKYLGFDVFI